MGNGSQTNKLLLIIAGVLVAGAAFYYYDNYIEPKQDGPMERAGEKLDNAMDGK